MKWVRNVLGILLVLAFAGTPLVQTASAETLTVHGGTIIIRSQVLKTHYVIIDERARITEITSNTTDEAKPRVFLQKIAPGHERPLSEDIYQQYQAILPEGKAGVGTVYKRSEVAQLSLFSSLASSNNVDPLAFIKQKQ